MILINVTDAIVDKSMIARPRAEKGKGRFGKCLVGHIRKIALLILNFFLFIIGYDRVFSAIGWLNRRYNFLATVFVAYPATESYANAYVYKRHRHWMAWRPWPAGIFCQNGKLGLMTVISSMHADFYDPDSYNNLKVLVDRTEEIRQLLGAEQKTFAGVLPGVLYSKRLIRESIGTQVTVEALLQVEKELKSRIGYPDNTPLIILGGRGFVGRFLIRALEKREIYSVDSNGNENTANLNDWPGHLRGKKAILINLTKKAALGKYIHLFWPELALANEVYPEPTPEEIRELTAGGNMAFHVVGLKAKSFPPFPKAYRGGIPCCAGRMDKNMEVIVRRLN